MSSGLLMECRLARGYTLEDTPDALAYLLIKVMPDSTIQVGSLPLNISLVIDVSRSMAGEKIRYACEAAKLLVKSLRDEDLVSLITFSDEATLLVPTTEPSDKPHILSEIDGIKIQSGTRMSLGMDRSVREIQRTSSPDNVSQIILLTDGQTENQKQCRNIAIQAREKQIGITTIGIGKKYNEGLLAQIADATLGRFYHLKTPPQIVDIFQKEFDNATDSAISRVSLSLRLEHSVRLESLDRIFPSSAKLQTRSEVRGKVLTADIGAVGKDRPIIVGAQLKLPARPPGNVKVAHVSISYSIPSQEIEDITCSRDVFTEYTSDQSLCTQVDREVIGYFSQINAQKFIEQAIAETKQGNISDATRSLFEAQEITQRLGNLPLAENIKEAIKELGRSGTISENGIKTIKAGSRFTIRLDKAKVSAWDKDNVEESE